MVKVLGLINRGYLGQGGGPKEDRVLWDGGASHSLPARGSGELCKLPSVKLVLM